MATRDEMIAAVEQALSQAGTFAERLVTALEALDRLQGSSPSPTTPSTFMLVEVVPTSDAQKQQADQIKEQSLALVRAAVCPT